MAQLFLTIACEEIPARMQKKAGADLQQMMMRALDEAGLMPQGAKAYFGPRHIALRVADVRAQQATREIEKRGPRCDAPDKAIEGFCQSVGMSRAELTQEETAKGTFFFARKSEIGQPTISLLPAMICDILSAFPWPKSQRWGTSRQSWVRPMHQIGVLFDGRIVPGAFDLGGDMQVVFSNEACGHPFHAPDSFTFADADEWESKLADQFVIADADKKSQMISEQMAQKTAPLAIEAIPDDGLMSEVTGLVEWPNVIIGEISEAFMSLPEEVLITSMRVHQKYFATRFASGAKAGQIAPYFITIANRKSDAKTDALIQNGNERVLRARLADAAFFYEQDKATELAQFVPQLDKITFYEGLGSVGDKVVRMMVLATAIAPFVPGAEQSHVQQAAQLAKADLVTDMVGEFPELQGIMGGYYAAHHGADSAVVHAISDHYKPAGPSDHIPASPTGLVVSLSDKIDTLVGFFGIGAKPTGSKDPFALRRAALAILRMCDEAQLSLPLDSLFAASAKAYGFKSVDDDLPDFVRDRLTVMLRDEGLAHDVVAAAIAGAPITDPLFVMVKARQLANALGGEAGAKILAGFKRAHNILAAEAKKSQTALPTQVDESLFIDPQEGALFSAISALPATVQTDEDIAVMLGALGALATPIDAFFDAIIVNHETAEIRDNRLALLALVVRQMGHIADFSKIER